MIDTIILIILITLIIIYKYRYKLHLKSIEAFDNNIYYVNDLPDAVDAANMLAILMLTIKDLIKKILEENNNNDKYYIKYISIIDKILPYIKISENSMNNNYTSYSINKGEEIVLCIRNKKTNKIHDFNELLYVTIHEISHVGCPDTGHTLLFNKINKFILKKAICYNLYKNIDYSKNNKDYCGILLTSSILPNNLNCNI